MFLCCQWWFAFIIPRMSSEVNNVKLMSNVFCFRCSFTCECLQLTVDLKYYPVIDTHQNKMEPR